MKKFLLTGVCALSLLAMTRQEASAWCNVRFGAGVNLAWQSGGTSIGWGLFRSAQPPGPDHGFGGGYVDGGHFGGGYGGPVGGGYFGGAPYGNGHFDAPAPVPGPVPAPAAVPPMPNGHAYQYAQPYGPQGSVVYYNGLGYQPYQTVNYPGYYYNPSSYYGR